MKSSQFHYDLPPDLIAQEPAAERTSSRLLVVPGQGGEYQHLRFADLAELVHPGDLLVVNDTRVIPARLCLKKPTGGKVEMLLERVLKDNYALVMLKSSKPIREGQELLAGDVIIQVTGRKDGFFLCRIPVGISVLELFQETGVEPAGAA